MSASEALTFINLGVLGVVFLMLLRGDLRLRREVEREREVGDGYKLNAVAVTTALDRLTGAVDRQASRKRGADR